MKEFSSAKRGTLPLARNEERSLVARELARDDNVDGTKDAALAQQYDN